jgi:hypothetical protein
MYDIAVRLAPAINAVLLFISLCRHIRTYKMAPCMSAIKSSLFLNIIADNAVNTYKNKFIIMYIKIINEPYLFYYRL